MEFNETINRTLINVKKRSITNFLSNFVLLGLQWKKLEKVNHALKSA